MHPLPVRYMMYLVLNYLTYFVPVNVAKINHNTAIIFFELYYYGEFSQRVINRQRECVGTLVLYQFVGF